MHFSYPKDIEAVLSSLPPTLEECTHRILEFSLVYQKLYIQDPDSAELLLHSAAHLKYRQILLSQDHSEQSEAFVLSYEHTLPRMIWKSEARSNYLFEADWEIACDVKNGKQLAEFFEDDRDIYELQMLRLPCNIDNDVLYLERLFVDPVERIHHDLAPVVESRQPTPLSVLAKIRDVRHISGKSKMRTGATVLVASEDPLAVRLPAFGPYKYEVLQIGKVYESYAPTQLINPTEFAVMSRISDGLATFISACGIPIYSGVNYSMFPLLQRFSAWKRKKKARNREIRTLQECAYQKMMHSWLMGFNP